MKLSKRTLKILKNFSEMNPNLRIRKNTNKVNTITAMKNILATTTIEEKFTNEINLYDSKEFVKILNTLSNPEITKVDKEHIHIKSDDFSIKYRMSDPSNMIVVNKEVNFPKIIKLSNIIKQPDILFCANGKVLKCIIMDKHYRDGSDITFIIGKTKDSYSAFFKTENINKLLDASYDVKVSHKFVSLFENIDDCITNYIAFEPDSIFQNNTDWNKSDKERQVVKNKIKKLNNSHQTQLNKLQELLIR
jgi:hypothetical protein